jgi:hypothetical protein
MTTCQTHSAHLDLIRVRSHRERTGWYNRLNDILIFGKEEKIEMRGTGEMVEI